MDGRPLVEGNRVHGGHTAGIYVAGAESRGKISENEIYQNRDGVVVREGGAPSIERNRIHDQTVHGA